MLATWTDYVPDPDHARDVADETRKKVRSTAEALRSADDRACAEALVGAAAECFRIIVITEPKHSVAGSFSAAFERARGWLEREPSPPSRAPLAGVLAFAPLTAPNLPRAIDWLEAAARAPRSSVDIDRVLGFAALAHGRPDLAAAFTGDEALARLVDATKRSREEIWRALVDFVTAFPESSHGYPELGLVGRAYFTYLDKATPPTAAPWLHRIVHHGPGEMPPEPIPAPAPQPPRIEVPPELAARIAPLLAADHRPPSRALPFASFGMSDIHGLWGGHAMRVDADGRIVVELRVIGNAPPWFYRARLSDAGIADLDALLARHPVRTILRSTRPGIPDETCPSVSIVDAAGTYSVWRWGGDGTPAFHAILRWCNDVARFVEASTVPSAADDRYR